MSGQIHEGGCFCGAVRYRTNGEPKRVSLCSCTWCRKRTGSPLGLSVYFDIAGVDFLSGETQSFRLTSDAGRWLETRFCVICATTVGWTLEFLPGHQGIAGGTFDEPDLWTPHRYVFCAAKPDWLGVCESIPRFTAMP